MEDDLNFIQMADNLEILVKQRQPSIDRWVLVSGIFELSKPIIKCDNATGSKSNAS